VVGEGGYDLCSDTKAKPLMWRRFAEEFVGKNQYTAAQAFQIKNVYYKNLCAYEISTHWGTEPPPKEILEEVTAKGGNVMMRTLENFARPAPKEEQRTQEGDTSDASPEQRTPKVEAADGGEELGSATGRSTRGLRQAPPQRVLFQPDLTSARQTRGPGQVTHGSAAPAPPPAPMAVPSFLTNGASSTLASYEPSHSYPLSLKPVVTPANNPEYYRNERKRKAEANAGPLAKKYRNIMLPGSNFVGPNIYVRAQLSLQSGIPEEEQYALHHLVKISHERGDKYRFDQFPGLAEALVKKMLQVVDLFYDVDWEVSYDDMSVDDEMLNGLSGTSDLIEKLKSRIPLPVDDSMQTAAGLSQLHRITEAGLVLRNMCLQSENAQYLAKQPLTRDYVAIVLNLPQHPSLVELQHYALDTAEQLLVWCDLGPQDALYQSLLAQLLGRDRGAIAACLRILSRLAMHIPGPKRLDDVPRETLRRLQEWLMLEDEELQSACLDFLFQYTTFADNVDSLLQALSAESLARQLSRLLLFGAREQKAERPPTRQQEETKTIALVPRLSQSVVGSLLKLEEPERSSEWLRMCFLPDSSSEMTQISLWQAYQTTFAQFHSTHPHLIAGDFIKNVSSTFQGATAQVAGANKYVIKGIRSRNAPIDTGMLAGSRGTDKGKELVKCLWNYTISVEPKKDPTTGVQSGPLTQDVACGEWFKHDTEMQKHVLRDHLRLPKKAPMIAADVDQMGVDMEPSRPPSAMADVLPDGPPSSKLSDVFDFIAADKTTYRCRWADCRRTSAGFDGLKTSRTALFARHIQTHLPETYDVHDVHNLKPNSKRTSQAKDELGWLTTLSDEKNDAAGIPLNAALVLRNIAKFMPKSSGSTANGVSGVLGAELPLTADGRRSAAQSEDDLMATVFDDEVRARLFDAAAHSRTIRDYVGSVLWAVKKSEK